MVKHVLAKDEAGVRFSLPAHILKIPKTVSEIDRVLRQNGFQGWLVGGCVRDLLMDITPQDWDFTTNAKPDEVARLFPKTFINNPYGTVTVVNEEMVDKTLQNIEITTFRLETKYSDRRHPDKITFGHNLEDDLQRRDFTINAIAYDLDKGQISDPYKGQKDINDKIIRTVGAPDERFDEDPLRILRGIRLATQLGFTLEQQTYESMQNHAGLLIHISKERIRDEFTRIINSKNPTIGLVLSQKMGVLKHIMPELEEGIHVKQNGEHKYDVWEHTLRTIQYAADKNFPFHVRLAGLLHDIGKPRTRAWDNKNQDYTFYGHEIVGTKMAQNMLKRLKYGNSMVTTVTTLVRNHMFFADPEKITLSAVRRVINKVGHNLVWDLMNLRICDRIGMGRPKADPYRLRKYKSMVEEALRTPISVATIQINGDDVLRETKLKPGPKIGYILHALLEAVLNNPELNSRDYLVQQAKKLAQLPEKELENLGEKGKEKKTIEEEKEIQKIRQKYWVK